MVVRFVLALQGCPDDHHVPVDQPSSGFGNGENTLTQPVEGLLVEVLEDIRQVPGIHAVTCPSFQALKEAFEAYGLEADTIKPFPYAGPLLWPQPGGQALLPAATQYVREPRVPTRGIVHEGTAHPFGKEGGERAARVAKIGFFASGPGHDPLREEEREEGPPALGVKASVEMPCPLLARCQ